MTEEPPRRPWVVRFFLRLAEIALVGTIAAAMMIGVTLLVRQWGFDIRASWFTRLPLAIVAIMFAMYLWGLLVGGGSEKDEDED